MPAKKTSPVTDKFMLRFPEEMRKRIRDEAEKNCRSMNSEIIYQLSRAYDYGKNEKAPARS